MNIAFVRKQTAVKSVLIRSVSQARFRSDI